MLLTLSFIALLFASISAVVFFRNIPLYAPPPDAAPREEAVSIIIPARNEERSIRQALRSALASRFVDFEIIVANDQSIDATAETVREIARSDARVRLIEVPTLPRGWNGKQHACWVAAEAARFETLCFVDADLRLSADALTRMLAEMKLRKASLISGIPYEETRTWSERLMIPLISFVLLGYLPLDKVRTTNESAFAAGIGQLFMCDRSAYFSSGGHAAICQTLHDGLRLPRLFREHGFHTDLFDATSVATCRMYENFAQVWNGLAKNAVEGMASPKLIGIFTLLLFAGHILPEIVLAVSIAERHLAAAIVSAIASVLSYAPRVVSISKFRQSLISAMLHPFGIAVLLSIQWYALVRDLLGGESEWKGRAYSSALRGGTLLRR